MLQQKTFTRSEIVRLTALLHSRSSESSSADVVVRDGANLYGSPSSLLRLEASTSGSLKKHGDERDNLHAAVSTPMVTSRVLEEEIASPAELAKAYMGSRPSKVALRRDLVLHNNAPGFLKSPNTLIAPKIANGSTGFENGFTTPRSRGRSAMYLMARTPYARSPSTFTQKGITSSYGREEALTSSQSAFQHGGKMALKRRNSVLEDDIGSGGPLRRTRQRANLLTLRDKRELGYTALQQPDHASRKLLLMNESEPKIVKGAEQNRDTSMHGSGSVSGYANVPTKSTQTATKISQHIEKMGLKEKSSGSAKSPTKRTFDMLHGQALRSLEKVDSPRLLSYPHDNQKSEVQHHDRRELTSKGKEKVEDNGPRKFPVTPNMMSTVNDELSVTSKDKAPAVRINEPPLKLPAEPPQKKRAFQMSVPESDSFEIDDDDEFGGSPKIDIGFGGSVSEQGLGFKLPASPPLFPQATLPMDNVDPEKDSNSLPLFGTSAERVSPFAFSDNGLSDSKPSASSDPKALESISVSNSVTTNGHAKLTEPNNVENGNDQKSVNISGKVESNKIESITVISTTTPPTPAAIFSTSTPTSVIPSSVPPPVFSFGSATSTTPTISVAETGNTSVTNDKDLKSNLTNSPFASTPFSTTTSTGSGLFGFSSPAVTSTNKNQSQASSSNVSNGSQANTQASVPFLFGSGTTSIPSSTFGTSPLLSSDSPFGTSSSFGISSMTASSEVLDDDNHSTAPVQGNAPTTYAPTTYAATTYAPTTYAARSLALPRIYLEYDDPPQKKLRLSFSYNQ